MLNYTPVPPLALRGPLVITVCTCVSVQTDADNWVFGGKDAITAQLFSLSAADPVPDSARKPHCETELSLSGTVVVQPAEQ